MKILNLMANKEIFDRIASGEITEDCRDITPYWDIRLKNRKYDAIKYRRGYEKDTPVIRVECKGIIKGIGKKEWGASGVESWIIVLGNIIKAEHCEEPDDPERANHDMWNAVICRPLVADVGVINDSSKI